MDFITKTMKSMGGKINPPSSKYSDIVFIKEIESTKLLSPLSKKTYLKQIDKVTQSFFGDKKTIHWVITHPDEFKIACEKYGNSKNLKPCSRAQYIVPFLFCLQAFRPIMEDNPRLKYQWSDIRNEIREPDDTYDTPAGPTKKQIDANIPFDEVCQIRDSLPDGSNAKLLISLYTMMPPVRSDFDDVKIFDEKQKSYDKNYLILSKNVS